MAGSKSKDISVLAKIFAVLVIIGAITFFSLQYNAITTQFSTWTIDWAPSPCDTQAVAPPGAKAFAMHVFLMSLAFGVFAPIGAVTYVVVRDTFGLSQITAKVVHGICQMGAFVCSVLGYTQMYYAHGANCCGGPPCTVHFQSVHSYVGIVVLVIFWFQFPSALVVFSNNSLFPPGSFARKCFLKYHVFLGTVGVFAGLATLITGILVLTGKSTTYDPVPPAYWYVYAKAAMAAFITIFVLALSLFEAKSEHLSGNAQTVGASDPLLVTVGGTRH